MNDLRSEKERARRDLHGALQVPAYYFVAGNTANPRLVKVRIHNRATMVGDIAGFPGAGQVMDQAPSIVFLREDFDDAKRLGIVSVAKGEAYRIDSVRPPDGITRTALCVQLSESDANAYPTPGI